MTGKREHNARTLLLALGMGGYNATMAIPFMFIAPAATDPAMPPVILMTEHLQRGLRAAGMNCSVTGQIDDATARCLAQLVGPRWNQTSWFELYAAVQRAMKARRMDVESGALDLGLVPDLPALPAVPGGWITILGAGAVLYYMSKKSKKKGR